MRAGYLDRRDSASNGAGVSWDPVLIVALVANGVLLFAYRVWRLAKGGPTYDVIGGALLALALGAIAAGFAAGAEWLRWAAFTYAALFALVVMPIWTLAVLIPMRPGPIDVAFTAIYWASLILIGLAAILT
jgi:hypothetical protein